MGGLTAAALLLGLTAAAAQSCNGDYECSGVAMCSDGACAAPMDCPPTAIVMDNDKSPTLVQIRGRCRVTLEQIRLAFPAAISKSGTEGKYTLNYDIWIRDGAILEIHGSSAASSSDTAVSLLKLKSDATSSVSIKAWHGKLSINGTAITSWDALNDAPDERLEGRAFIAALSGESDSGGVHTSRMDVEDSEISYLGNEGDFHNDIDLDYGLVWKVQGFDDRFPDVNLDVFNRVGVYGSLKGNNLHDNYMGAYCYGMKGDSEWSHNKVHNNFLNGLNPQDNSDGMSIHDNHVHDNGWHGIEYSKRCQGAKVFDNVVEDNARAGIFFHRSTDNATAYDNTCRRNLEGDFGIVESAGCLIHNNTMEGGKYGIRLSLGAQENEVYDNVIMNSTRYGVFFFRGSDEAEASADWEGRPRRNIIRNNQISDPVEGQGVAVTGSDDNDVIDNTFAGIDSLRFDDAFDTLVTGNVLPDGVEYKLEEGATLVDGSQEPTD